MIPNIGLFDICLGFFYLFVIYYAFYLIQKKQISSHPEYRWVLAALSAKIVGSILFVLISIFYYKSGDSFLYYQIGESIRGHLHTNISEVINLMGTPYDQLQTLKFNPLEPYNFYYERSSTWFFSRIVFLFNTIGFGSYLVSSILFSVVSFSGLWLGYSSFCRLYPKADRLLLIPFFLIPTALIWSSGILKDTLIIGIVGLLFYALSNSFIFKKKRFTNICLIIFCFLLIQFLKPIFLIVFLPCVLIWAIPYMTKFIVKTPYRIITKISIFLIVTIGGYFMNKECLIPTSKYRIENLFHTLQGFQSFHSMEVFAKGQNVYTLGGIATTPTDAIKKIPEAINVTFFRPYLWEVNNWPMLLGAIESSALFLVFTYLMLVLRKAFFKILRRNNEVIFTMIFSVFYAVVVGMSAYNFGALSRYKIPAVMLFMIGLIIIYTESGKSIVPNFIKNLLKTSQKKA